ncbi:kinesin-like protein Klp61F [Vanessa tameamea]|uniref:Kinesin-like protein Klp61F n=1 Tax=Vanessa tameamea TaxID=334116 RepID=A0ABM4ASC5_VANTA
MTSEKGCRKEKNQNIQVFVRLRPLNQRERDIKSLGVVEVVNGREVVVRQSQQSMHTKRFTFDRAFPPLSKQVEIYQEVVSPLIEEVLAGYNCTVFAYGQTGTGKTHTMVGEAAADETTWQSDPLAGIIPRALSQIFDELRISNTEYTVRVSYLELYNEELFDLLSTSEDNSKLRIYEDVTRKGANIVNGLEEITVYNKNEVYKIMAQGQERKRVASTLMNAQSSRSHTVFTIVIHMKENSPEGEELVKIGKLNLVDLAGSENISKAGSDNPAKKERARECVNINQSLLTLGRVITALVERHPHIPYRESKLTRILQESLGGRTKTSIIATISPGHKDLEETMSTLEYANRAKNIQNKPEVNQKMTKKAILKDYAEEIDRLKRDLHAAREKNGVYLANETFAEMTLKQEEQRKEIQELLLKKRAMEEERERMESVFKELNCSLEEHKQQLNSTVSKLCSTENMLANTTNMLKTTKMHYEEQRFLVSKQMETEKVLSSQAKQLLEVADAASTDAAKLLDSIDKRKTVESTNLDITRTYREISAQHRNNLTGGTENFVGALMQALADVQTTMDSYTHDSTQMQNLSKQRLDDLVQQAMETMNKMTTLRNDTHSEISRGAQAARARLHEAASARAARLRAALARLAACVLARLRAAAGLDLTSDMASFLDDWVSPLTRSVRRESGRQTRADRYANNNIHTFKKNAYIDRSDPVSAPGFGYFQRSLQSSGVSLLGRLQQSSGALATVARQSALRLRQSCAAQRQSREGRAERLGAHILQRIDSITEEKERTERYLAEQVTSIEREKSEYESRLQQWAEEERRLLEERIERHITAERTFLEENMNQKLKDIENQRAMFEQRTAESVDQLNSMLKVNQEVVAQIGEDLLEQENELEKCLNDLKVFVEDYEKDHAVMVSNVNSLSDGALKVVETIKTDLIQNLEQTQSHVEDESRGLIEQEQESATCLMNESNYMIESMVQTCQRTLDNFVGAVNVTTTSTKEELSSLSSIASNITTTCQTHHDAQTLTLATVQREVEQFYGRLREEVSRLEELESRCLNQEYAVYCPTGSTPQRAQYRYPRALAASSPPARALAAFRAARAARRDDDDCILVENESEARSDSESSASEDSAVVFAAPSPPDSVNHKPSIMKCTSETDIYLRQRQQDQQGKENVNRSMSFKKPSKLPAPTAHKTPLLERNAR